MSDNIFTYQDGASLGGAQGIASVIESLISKMQTATIVRVEAVNEGATGAVGTVNVKPLVMQMTASGEAISIATIYNVPYFRLQGGINAVIIDPQVGDIGLAIFASRDISAVKRTKAESAPSSLRKYDLADGLYIGGFLNGAPEQYIYFKPDGGIKAVSTGDFEIEAEGDIKMTAKGSMSLESSETMTLKDPSTITLDTPSTMITGGMTGGSGVGGVRSGLMATFNIPVTFKQLAAFEQDGKFSGISFLEHTHGGVESGGSETEKPTG